MQGRVRGKNNTIQASEDNGNHNKSRLVSIVTQVDLDRCINFIEKVRQERFNKVKARQVRNFDILNNKNKTNHICMHSSISNRQDQGVNADRSDNNNQMNKDKDIDKWVINLSKKELTPAQKSVLAKGPNFAIYPNNIPNLEYITAFEAMCPKLKEEDALELRADINALLRERKDTQIQFKQGRMNRINTT